MRPPAQNHHRRPRTALYKKFSRLGWRTREPVSDELRAEQPKLTTVIAEALHDKGFSAEDVARVAGYASPAHNTMLTVPGKHLRAV